MRNSDKLSKMMMFREVV